MVLNQLKESHAGEIWLDKLIREFERKLPIIEGIETQLGAAESSVIRKEQLNAMKKANEQGKVAFTFGMAAMGYLTLETYHV